MRSFFPIIFAAVFILILGMIEIILLRLLNKEWWDNKKIRLLAWLLPLVGGLTILLWALGEYNALQWLSVPAASVVVVVFVLEIALMMSLPVSGLIHLLDRLLKSLLRRKKSSSEKIDRHRRVFLKGAAAAVPLVTMATGVSGVARAFDDVRVFKKPLIFEQLPSGWEGLKILHLSDLHLRRYITLTDLADVLERAKEFSPDLILITGDVADDLDLLPETLAMIDAVKAPLGSYACLGNHEYFRGINRVKKIFSASSVPLLVNRSLTIPVRGGRLLIGGIDDPLSLRGKHGNFFKKTIEESLQGEEPGEFSILMSHRPDALEQALQKEYDLVLAGHTHGGQVGLFGRSVFEQFFPDSYLWGHYQRGKTHLYTSSGVGHWFPFRLGCPAEAPVIELHRG